MNPEGSKLLHLNCMSGELATAPQKIANWLEIIWVCEIYVKRYINITDVTAYLIFEYWAGKKLVSWVIKAISGQRVIGREEFI